MSTLQMLREAAGYFSPEEFAVKANVSSQTIRRAEHGLTIRRKSALHIARALGKHPNEIDELKFVGKESLDHARDIERLEGS